MQETPGGGGNRLSYKLICEYGELVRFLNQYLHEVCRDISDRNLLQIDYNTKCMSASTWPNFQPSAVKCGVKLMSLFISALSVQTLFKKLD